VATSYTMYNVTDNALNIKKIRPYFVFLTFALQNIYFIHEIHQ